MVALHYFIMTGWGRYQERQQVVSLLSATPQAPVVCKSCPAVTSAVVNGLVPVPCCTTLIIILLPSASLQIRPPMPPVYFFAIDVSAGAVGSGMVAVVANAIKSCLDSLPGDERTLIGFLTYDSALHFYNLKASLAAPQMMVVGEVDDPFLPLPDDLLVNLKESREVVDALLDSLPGNFANNTVHDCATGPALQVRGLTGRVVVLSYA